MPNDPSPTVDNWLDRMLTQMKVKAGKAKEDLLQKGDALVSGGEAAAAPATPTPLPSGKNQVLETSDAPDTRQVVVETKEGGVATRVETVQRTGEDTAFTESSLEGTTGFDLAGSKREIGKHLTDVDAELQAQQKALAKRKGDPAAAQQQADLTARRAQLKADLKALAKADLAAVSAIAERNGLEVQADDAARQGLKTGTLTITKGTQGKDGAEIESVEEIQAWSDDAGNTTLQSVKKEGQKTVTTVTQTKADGSEAQFVGETDSQFGALGDGMVGGSRSQSEEFRTTDALGNTTSQKKSKETKGGLMVDGSAVGAGGQQNRTNEVTTKGGYTGKVERTAGGCYMADIAELSPVFEKGAWVKKFEITLTLKANAKAKTSGGKGGQSVSAGASAEVALVFKQILTEAAKTDYLLQAKKVDAGGKAGGAWPEFKSLERLVALARGGGELAAGMAGLVDADFAKSLPEGQSMALDLTGQVEGGAEGKAGALGVKAGASQTWKRGVQIATGKTEKGLPVVNVTLTFSSAQEVTGGASAMGAEMQGKSGSSSGDSFGFRLAQNDPSYRDWFDQIKLLPTPDAARAFAKANPALVASRGWSAGESSQMGSGFAGEKGPKITQTSNLENTAQVADGTVTGAGKGSSGVELGPIGGSTSRLDATVDEGGGVAVDVGNTTSAWDPLRTAQELVTKLVDDPIATAEEQGQAVVGKGVGGALEALLFRKYEDLRGYQVSPEDFKKVVQRAADKKNWSDCSLTPKTLGPWEALRKTLVNPVPQGEWVAMDTFPGQEQSKQVARAHALAEFMADHGYAAQDAMKNVLRHWGEGPGHKSVNSGADLGGQYDWPSSLAKEKARLDAAETQINGAAKTLAPLKGNAQAIHAFVLPLFTDLVAVREAVKSCPDITSERARAEMIARTTALEDQLRRARDAVEGGAPSEAETKAQTREIEALKKELWDMRQKEAKLFDEARANLRDIHGGSIKNEDSFFGSVGAVFSEDVVAVSNLLNQVSELHEFWITRILRLRELYRETNTPDMMHMVSMSPSAARNPNYEPHIDELIEIHQNAADAQSGNSANSEFNTRVYGQWKARAKY